jgi:site-specific DNA-methyltransferase (adenine-specific)
VKPYYEDEAVTIYHGDCREILPTLSAGAVHMIATDPPYFRVVDDKWDDQWGADPAEFLRWVQALIGQLEPLLCERGTFAIFCSPDMACAVETEVRRAFNVLNHVVWRKPSPGRLGRMEKDSMRRFFPTSERIILAEKSRTPDSDLWRFRDHVNHSVARDVYADVREQLVRLRDEAGCSNAEVDKALGKNGMAGHYFGASQWSLPTEGAWEIISALFATKGVDCPSYQQIRQEFDSRRQEFDSRRREFDSRRREFDSRRREFDSRLELLSDVWTFKPPLGGDRLGHSTQKPLALMDHMVGTMTRRDDTVLDPFMGSGTTLRAAKDLGRKAIGIEMEERYCEIAAERMGQEVLDLGAAA